jgi:carbon starvation protein CstA
MWIIAGCVVAGAVHDMVVLFASVRHKGQSLAKIAESEVGRVVGNVASVAILLILILTLAGLSIAVVNAMFSSPWGTFTVFCTIPIAIIMYAGYLKVVNTFWPQKLYLLTGLSILIMVLMVIVLVGTFRRWAELLKIKSPVWDDAGDQGLVVVPE